MKVYVVFDVSRYYKTIFVILNLKEVLYFKDLVMEAVSYLTSINIGYKKLYISKDNQLLRN